MPAGGSAACKIPVLEPSIARGCPALHSCLRACSSGNAEASDAAAELAARLRAAEQDVGEAEVMAAEAVGMAERAQVGGRVGGLGWDVGTAPRWRGGTLQLRTSPLTIHAP